MNKPETLFTVKEIAEKRLLGYGQRTIRQLIKDKKIRTIDISDIGSKKSSIRVPESAIRDFLKERNSDF